MDETVKKLEQYIGQRLLTLAYEIEELERKQIEMKAELNQEVTPFKRISELADLLLDNIRNTCIVKGRLAELDQLRIAIKGL